MGKSNQPKISDEVKAEVERMVEQFNQEVMSAYTDEYGKCFYLVRFKSSFCYLDRSDWGQVGPIFRLTYTGGINNWHWAIFKWSTETYDGGELFPGIEHLDGTLRGAMLAGLKAYPA